MSTRSPNFDLQTWLQESHARPLGSVLEHAAHFKVDPNDGCLLNGRPVSLDDVKVECTRLSQGGGIAFYFRDNPQHALPQQLMSVIDSICEAKLPLVFAFRDYDPGVEVAQYFPQQQQSD